MIIVQATEKHISELAPLFDAYRIFYGQKTNLEAATIFLKKRFSRSESVVFIAYENEVAVGFTQLYTTFSSVTLEPFFILNDLYVDKNHRAKGVGEALLKFAQSHCINMGFKGLQLETAIDNPAQKLYERLQWKKDPNFLHYFWSAPKKPS
ncbi:MAG: GNAT family N-acetyltransferase [Croceitalea sp.]|nr:GNAT family N-acetyltransferase [Croceitalea sp.]